MLGRATIVVTVLVFAMMPASAIATPQDIASTHAYIQANYALARATEAKVTPAQADVEALNQKLAGECPKVGVGSPEDAESQPMSYEVAVALWSVSYGADAAAIHTFANTVKRLHWSNSRLTHIAQSYAADLQELATLALPNLCGDVRAWKATSFRRSRQTRLVSSSVWKRSNRTSSRRHCSGRMCSRPTGACWRAPAVWKPSF